MPTLREKFSDVAARKNLSPETVSRTFEEHFGIPTKSIKGSVDWDTFKQVHATGALPTLVESYSGVGPLDNDILKSALSASKRPPEPKQAPVSAVGLPSAGEPEGEPSEIKRMGGITAPLEALERAGGVVAGAVREAGARAALAAGANVPGFVRAKMDIKQREAEKAHEEERAKKLKIHPAERIVTDTLGLVMALPNVLNSMVSSFEVAEGQTPFTVGEALGKEISRSTLAQAKGLLDKPEEEIAANPVDAAVILLPVAVRAAKYAGSTKVGQAVTRGISAGKQALADKLRSIPGVDNLITNKFGKRVDRQTFIDLYATGDAAATEFLEDMLAGTQHKAEAAAREAAPLRKMSAQFEESVTTDKGIKPELLGNIESRGTEAVKKAGAQEAGSVLDKSDTAIKKGHEAIVSELQKATKDPRTAAVAEELEAAKKAVDRAEPGFDQVIAQDRYNKAVAKAEEIVGPVSGFLETETATMVTRGTSGSPELRGAAVEEGMAKTIEAGRAARMAEESEKFSIRSAETFRKARGGEGSPTPMLLDITSEEGIAADKARSAARAKKAEARDLLESHLMDYEDITIGGKKYLAHPRIAYAYNIENAVNTAKSATFELLQKLTTAAKQVALPLNPKSILSNVLGNEFMTSLFDGSAPFVTRVPAAKLALDWRNFWKKSPKERAAVANGEFFEAISDTGLIGSDRLNKDIKVVQGFDQLDKVAGIGGKAMEIGDEIYKLPVAKASYDSALDLINKVGPGESITLPISQQTKVTLTREGNKLVVSTPGKGRHAQILLDDKGMPRNAAGLKVLQKVAGRYGAHMAKELFFDYGRVPAWISHLRKAPGVGAASPFTTWAFKALSLPGIKRGLLQTVFEGPGAGISSTSGAVNRQLLKEATALSMNRGMLLGLLRNDEDERQLAQDTQYIPGSVRTQIVNATTDPGALAIASFSSANFLEPTLEAYNAIRGGIERLVQEPASDVFDRALKAEDQDELFKGLRVLVKRARSRDPISAALGVAGLSGGILFDIFNKMQESARAGEDFSIEDALVRGYVPSWLRPIYAGVIQGVPEFGRLARAPMNKEQQEKVGEFITRTVLGLGWRYIDSRAAMESYTRAVQSELTAQLDVYEDRKKKEAAMRGASEKELLEIATRVAVMKSAIKAATKVAKYDWVMMNEKLTKKAARRARAE